MSGIFRAKGETLSTPARAFTKSALGVLETDSYCAIRISAVSEAQKLQEENQYLSRQIWSLQSEVSQLKKVLSEMTDKCRPYLEALKATHKAVKEFIVGILKKFKKQEKSIVYEPIPALKNHTQERLKRSKNKDIER
jgi:predicted RNase H-like nuclease (RuvC/YqgF family)